MKLKLNVERLLGAAAAVFAVTFLLDYLVHSMVLVEMYEDTIEVWRDPEDMMMWPMFTSQILFALVFVYFFSRNYEAKGMGEGVRFGLYVGLLFAAMNLGSYAYMPVSFTLVAAWMIASVVKCILLGLTTALVYRK